MSVVVCLPFRSLLAAKVRKIIQKTAFGEDINTISTLKCAFCQEKRYIEDGNSPRKQLNSIKTMNRKVLFWPLAAMLLTACEKGLDEGIADVAPAGQVTNSVLQVRTRSGGSAGEEATVAYPIAVYFNSFLPSLSSSTTCLISKPLEFEGVKIRII